MPKDKDKKSQQRDRGRPSKNDEPAISWEEVDALIVNGETVETENGTINKFPSLREIGRRFGVSHTLISNYANQHNCYQRREQTTKRVKEMADTKLAELRSTEIALKNDDLVRAIERFLVKFEQALIEDRVRCDNPSDYNTMARLRALIIGDADARSELINNIDLDEMEKYNKEMEKSWKEAKAQVRGDVVEKGKTKNDLPN